MLLIYNSYEGNMFTIQVDWQLIQSVTLIFVEIRLVIIKSMAFIQFFHLKFKISHGVRFCGLVL